jgi:hypothetical protein
VGQCGAEDVVRPLPLAHVALKLLRQKREKALRSVHGIMLFLSFGVTSWSSNALAYRPFDSTDPAVADVGEIEVELSPVSFRHHDSGETWMAPQLRLNYGFAEDWEIVLEGEAEHSRSAQSALVGNALSVKAVLREGSLQDKTGLSLASEIGVLLPGVNNESGVPSWAAIAGQRWSFGTVHVNVAASLSREKRAEVFVGTIIEGPHSWEVRPVAELIYAREFGIKEEFALLAGAIWQVKDKLSFDVAVRQAQANARPETEIRAGLSFAFSVR